MLSLWKSLYCILFTFAKIIARNGALFSLQFAFTEEIDTHISFRLVVSKYIQQSL